MQFTWTIPTGSPINRMSDPYSLMVFSTNMDSDGTYTVFLNNKISYDGTDWSETVSYDIYVVNPCSTTELYYNETIIEEMVYEVTNKAETQSFVAVTDTITNAIQTSGNCGNILYTLRNNETDIGTPFIEVIDLQSTKGLRVYTDFEEYIGNYTITV